MPRKRKADVEFPSLTEYERRVFDIFVRNHTPGYWDRPVQLEGNRRISIVAAGHRLIKKGILRRNRSCRWYLTDLGLDMVEQCEADDDARPPKTEMSDVG